MWKRAFQEAGERGLVLKFVVAAGPRVPRERGGRAGSHSNAPKRAGRNQGTWKPGKMGV